MKKLHLICNAHLDPVWLWDWEEGAAAALSTFRSAVKLAGEFDFIFCHNEALVYQWVEDYDPALFAKIQRLAREGRWRIMGGWYLQPDCNLPSGESFVRQIQAGRRYFQEKFGQKPRVAVNVDPFGHTAGLVQILKKTRYSGYLICRPGKEEMDGPDDFLWRGMDGSEVWVCRASGHYNSLLGEAAEKIRKVIAKEADQEVGIVLWGVGNHGGGPSRRDLGEIQELMGKSSVRICHSTPEAYMEEKHSVLSKADMEEKYSVLSKADMAKRREDRPKAGGSKKPAFMVRTGSLGPCMPGCYTSMVRIKQLHRRLENQLYATEKLCSAAAIQAGVPYPMEELWEAERDLLMGEFHDILPGSAISDGEETGMRRFWHGLEIVNRLRARAFFALTRDEDAAAPGQYPVLVYNPHPYSVKTVVDTGFMMENQNWTETFTDFMVYQGEERLPSQLLKEPSNINLDWAKRIAFTCELKPMSINRFDCRPFLREGRPSLPEDVSGDIIFENAHIYARIGRETGLLEEYAVDGQPLLSGAAVPVLYQDTADPWAMSPEQWKRLGEPKEDFCLMKPEECAAFTGDENICSSIRIIEEGQVLTEVETLLKCRSSVMQINYRFYREGTHVDIRMILWFLEKDGMVKYHVPLTFSGSFMRQTAYSREELPANGQEAVMQKWAACSDGMRALGILNNGTYGLDCTEREFHVTLIRSAAYAAHPIEGRPLLRRDRIIPRMDQGQREFSFRLLGGDATELMQGVERQALLMNEEPFALQMFPEGTGEASRSRRSQKPKSLLEITGPSVVMTTFKASRDGGYILRLFHNGEECVECKVKCPALGIRETITLGAFEIGTWRMGPGWLREEDELGV